MLDPPHSTTVKPFLAICSNFYSLISKGESNWLIDKKILIKVSGLGVTFYLIWSKNVSF